MTRVVVYVSDKGPNAKVLNSIFFVTPDGKHAIAGGEGVINFGATPFAEARKTIQDRADGATRECSAPGARLRRLRHAATPRVASRHGATRRPD